MARRSADSQPQLAIAERATRGLKKLGLRHAQGFGNLGDALIAQARGDQDRTAEASRVALERFEAGGMEMYAALTQLLIARVVGGSEAETLTGAAAAYTRREQIQDPETLFEMLAPGTAESV